MDQPRVMESGCEERYDRGNNCATSGRVLFEKFFTATGTVTVAVAVAVSVKVSVKVFVTVRE